MGESKGNEEKKKPSTSGNGRPEKKEGQVNPSAPEDANTTPGTTGEK